MADKLDSGIRDDLDVRQFLWVAREALANLSGNLAKKAKQRVAHSS